MDGQDAIPSCIQNVALLLVPMAPLLTFAEVLVCCAASRTLRKQQEARASLSILANDNKQITEFVDRPAIAAQDVG